MTTGTEPAAEQSEREQRLQMLVDNMPGVMWTTDADLRLLTISGAALSRMPFQADDLLGRPLPEVLGPEAVRYRDEMAAPLLGSPSFFEVQVGDLVLSVSSRPLELEDGTRGTMSAAIDVTTNRQAEEGLRRAADRLRSLRDLLATIISARSPEEVARLACQRMRELTSCLRVSVSVFDTATGTGRLVGVSTDGPTELRPGYEYAAESLGAPVESVSAEGMTFDDLAAMEDLEEPYATLAREGVRSYLVTPLVVDGEMIGLLALGGAEPGGFDEGAEEIAREVASPLAIAFQHARLREQTEANAEELGVRLNQLHDSDAQRRHLLATVVRGQEEERRRISNDIHDDSVQKMAAVGLRLDAIRHSVSDPEVLAQIDQLASVVSLSIGRLRRLMFELWPPDLERYGLAAAIRADLLAQREDHDIEFELRDEMTTRVPLEERIIAYRILQEALSNVRRHSGASRVEVALSSQEGGIHALVSDDGRGLPTTLDGSPPGHLGLTAMRERAQLAGGWLRVVDRQPRGTEVEFFIPTEQPPEGPSLPEAGDGP